MKALRLISILLPLAVLASCTNQHDKSAKANEPASAIITTDDGKQLVLQSTGLYSRFVGEISDKGYYTKFSVWGASHEYSIDLNTYQMVHCGKWEGIIMRPLFNEDGYAERIEYTRTWNNTLERGVEMGAYELSYNESGQLTEIVNDYKGRMAEEEEDEDYPYYGGKTATFIWEDGNLSEVTLKGDKVIKKGEGDFDKKPEVCVIKYGYYTHTKNKYEQFTFAYDSFFQYGLELCEGLGIMGLLGKGPANLPDTYECTTLRRGELDTTTYFCEYELNEDGTIKEEDYTTSLEYSSLIGQYYRDGRKYEYEYVSLDSLVSKGKN